MNASQFLLENGYITVLKRVPTGVDTRDATQLLGTILSNMAYYGYVPSKEAMKKMATLSPSDLEALWAAHGKSMAEVTKANRNMDRFVVYKNFPQEVLEMSQAQYWVSQILMYWGLPNELFTQEEKERPALLEKNTAKVLHLAKKGTLEAIHNSLVSSPARWTDAQLGHYKYSSSKMKDKSVDFSAFSFKENAVLASLHAMEAGVEIRMGNATDVMRLCAGISGGDVSLREKVRFGPYKRSARRGILGVLNGFSVDSLVENFALRKNEWKRLLVALRPGDYSTQFQNVIKAYDMLYRGQARSYDSKIETSWGKKEALALLKKSPGKMVRAFHRAYDEYGISAINALVSVCPELSTSQLAKLKAYLQTINGRKQLMFAPKGNWSRVQISDNYKVKIRADHLETAITAINNALAEKVAKVFPEGVKLCLRTANIKLQTNDQKLATYGRGTVFPIPADMDFVRVASYWECEMQYRNVWFDNGVNFFDENWNSVGTCCWNETYMDAQGATFSGDPTNSKELKGRACQMIDLYLDKLARSGIRYAVWNVLCYSRIAFDDAGEVLATLQWGKDATSGNLYEPSRAQMVFPLTGKNLTKYVAYIDVQKRELVYLDANFRGDVTSAGSNTNSLGKLMPAYVEYLNSLPSVYDVFESAKYGDAPILYSDSDYDMEDGVRAYVFKAENPHNTFENIPLATIIGD